jgi:hypothetical protein
MAYHDEFRELIENARDAVRELLDASEHDSWGVGRRGATSRAFGTSASVHSRANPGRAPHRARRAVRRERAYMMGMEDRR